MNVLQRHEGATGAHFFETQILDAILPRAVPEEEPTTRDVPDPENHVVNWRYRQGASDMTPYRFFCDTSENWA